MPGKRAPFTPPSILFRPRRNPRHARAVVEAPGTAPGSEWFISMFVYRHSRRKRRQIEYKRGRVFVEGLSRRWVQAVDKIVVFALRRREELFFTRRFWDVIPFRFER